MVVSWDELGAMKPAVLVVLLPLVAAGFIGLAGRWLRAASHWPAILGVAGALAGSVWLFYALDPQQPAALTNTYLLYSWFSPVPGTSFDINFRIDSLTVVMLLTVCTVSLLVIVYSRDYMREHGRCVRGYERFFAFLALFVFSMCTLVLAGNFLLLYLGWEAVGLCSYLLIGFYYERPAAAAAAKKAFIVNRIGDFGFALGILFIYLWISPMVGPDQNPLDYAVVFEYIGRLSTDQCTAIALLLFCGAAGKSAQLPLYVWLPDAMEGPSPVSALIHAATMVTAGVYMVVRCGPIFTNSPMAMAVVAVIGAATALYAATIAVAQYDMKRILAYSTISQLGYMFLGVGVFAADSAIFHLFTHAFFKALLFLAAGSVMHAMGGIIDVRQFGGLRKVLPWTFAVFVVGGLALAGFPFLSGFFSKDEIIHAAFAQRWYLGAMAMLTALLTAFYTFRMIYLAFSGPLRLPEGVHAHESGRWMLVPLLLLAVGAIGVGYLGVSFHVGGFAGAIEPHGAFHHYLAPVVEPYARAAGHGAIASADTAEHAGHLLMYISAAIAVLGIALAWLMYVARPALASRVQQAAPETFTLLHHKYYVDELNDAVVVEPLRQAGGLFYLMDNRVVDGILLAIANVPIFLGNLLRPMQSGRLQGYALAMTSGLAVLILVVYLLK